MTQLIGNPKSPLLTAKKEDFEKALAELEARVHQLESGDLSLEDALKAFEEGIRLTRDCQQALTEAGLPADAVQLVQTTDREVVGQLITMPQYVDVIIPRGGKGLIERISAEARVPVIKHLDGNCHVYVDAQVDHAGGVSAVDDGLDAARGELGDRAIRRPEGGGQRRAEQGAEQGFRLVHRTGPRCARGCPRRRP